MTSSTPSLLESITGSEKPGCTATSGGAGISCASMRSADSPPAMRIASAVAYAGSARNVPNVQRILPVNAWTAAPANAWSGAPS